MVLLCAQAESDLFVRQQRVESYVCSSRQRGQPHSTLDDDAKACQWQSGQQSSWQSRRKVPEQGLGAPFRAPASRLESQSSQGVAVQSYLPESFFGKVVIWLLRALMLSF